jgi:flagellar basal-body rod modification protein FlgD
MATTVAPDPSATYNAINAANAAAASKSTASTTQTANEAGSADRFLKLLVTQMQNQDPLNPMDNAQVTSQMAQINTVSGIEKLNSTVQGLNAQFLQMQAVTGAMLVGRDVTVQGNRLQIEDGVGVGGFELDGTASSVKVEVLNGAGRVLDTLDLGTQAAGLHAFNWDAAAKGVGDGSENRFRITASNGTVAVSSTALMRDRVNAVSSSGTQLLIDTQFSGSVPYANVKAFN